MSTSGQILINGWDRFKLFFPFRKNFLLFFGFGLLLMSERAELLESMEQNEVFLRKSILEFLIDFFFQIWIVMIFLALVTTLFSFFYNRSRLKNKENFLLRNSYDAKSLNTTLGVDLFNTMRPFLGTLALQFGVDEVFTPVEYFRHIATQHQHVNYRLQMPFVKRYSFRKAYIIHQDVFGFFRVVLPKGIFDYFTQRASLIDVQLDYPPISLAHDEELESDQIKRVKGEWLHYKTFEPSDDVRRIIWRVYAQSRELVIREQENFSPFTSTVSFYITFENDHEYLTSNPWISDFMLSRYKEATWSIYYGLKKGEGVDVKYIPDQKLTGLEAESPLEHDHETISISEWLHDQSLAEYIYERDAYILCISPLVSISALSALVEQSPRMMVYLIIPRLAKMPSSTAKRWSWRDLVYRRPEGVEERNLKFYRFLGHHREFQKLISEKVDFLESHDIKYQNIEI